MLLIRPDEEQSVRNRIAMMREMIGESGRDKELEGQRAELEKLEKQLGEFRTSEEFRKQAKEYWLNNDVQLSAMAKVLQEVGSEFGKLSQSLENAGKLKKGEMTSDLEQRKNDLSQVGKNITEFVPSGERTGELVMRILETWEKLKGAKGIIEFMQGLVNRADDDISAVSKKMVPETNRLERLRKELQQKKSASSMKEFDEQRSKLEKLEARKADIKSAIKRRKKAIFDAQASIPDLNAALKRDAAKLSEISASTSSADSGRSLKELLTAYSIPYMRSLVAASAAKIPRAVFVSRQETAARTYDELAGEYENAIFKAKNRAKCKRCREMSEALLSGAVSHDSSEVQSCVASLQEGDIFEARKSLERAIATGNVHEYVRPELDKMMKELLELFDQKGEVSRAEEKLRKAGNDMVRARLDLMRLDYVANGVHSPSEFLAAVFETLDWLEGLGIIFGKEVRDEIEKAKDKAGIFSFSSTKGLTTEQADEAEALYTAVQSESAALGKIKGSQPANDIAKSEAAIASSVSATHNFENSLFLKSLISGDENARKIVDRMLQNAGVNAKVVHSYLDAAIKNEALKVVGDDVAGVSGRLSKIKGLCAEIGKLKASPLKKDSQALIAQKVTIGRKTNDLEQVLEDIIQGKIAEPLALKISDPKLDGDKLYSEVISNPQILEAIKKRLLEHSGTLGQLRGTMETQAEHSSSASWEK